MYIFEKYSVKKANGRYCNCCKKRMQKDEECVMIMRLQTICYECFHQGVVEVVDHSKLDDKYVSEQIARRI